LYCYLERFCGSKIIEKRRLREETRWFFLVICFIIGFVFAVTFVITKDSSVTSGVVMLPVGATIVCFNVIALLIASMVGKIRNKR
jgi:uncharacterized integral membrane protein